MYFYNCLVLFLIFIFYIFNNKKDVTSAANTCNVKDKTIRLRLEINNKTFNKLIRQQFSRKEMLKLNLSRKTNKIGFYILSPFGVIFVYIALISYLILVKLLLINVH